VLSPRALLDAWARDDARIPPPLLPILRALATSPPATLEALAAAVASINAEEDPLPRIEFVPGIWVLPVRSPTLPPATHTNVWMSGGGRFVVVDPGTADPAEQQRIRGIVRRREVEGGRVDSVLLTHQHKDHAAGAADVARALGVPVRAHAQTFALLGAALDGVRGAPVADGERIDLDDGALEAVYTPGHAPGHLVFFDRDRSALISGDLVSGVSTILIGGLDGGDMAAYLASLGRAAALGARHILPSHGPPLGTGALEAALAHRLDRERKVAAAVTEHPRPLGEISTEAYADTPAADALLREWQTRAHLERLERSGLVERTDPSGTLWRAVDDCLSLADP
jgi:glyoxylase-like metal-dependent hydrolase (beta-lactamase superfamily II)